MGMQPAPWWLSSAALVGSGAHGRRLPSDLGATLRAVPALVPGRASKVAAVSEGRLGLLDGQRGLVIGQCEAEWVRD